MARPIEMRRITRQCFTPGCQNRDSFIFTRNREYRATVILCRDCVKEIYALTFPDEGEKATAERVEAKAEEKAKSEAKPKGAAKKAPAGK